MSKSMLLVMLFMMGSKVTGFLRETALAWNFGRSAVTDAYKAAFDLPCLVLSVVVTAISASFIPVYEQQQQTQDGGKRFVRNLFTVGFAVSVLITILTALCLNTLVKVMLPNANDSMQQLTRHLAALMMPMGLFVFLAKLTGSYLQSHFCFSIPAIAPLFLNISIIASIFISKGASIEYVAYGSLIGMALQFVIQIPSAHKHGLRYRPLFDLKDPGLRQIGILMFPVLISSAFDQVYLAFDRAVASGVAGDITALDYGNRISTMFSAVLLTSIATVLYPSLVKSTEVKDEFSSNLRFGINLNLLIAVPATVVLIMMRHPLARAIYQRGAFTAEDTLITGDVLACYSVGLLGIGLRELCNRAFYAHKDTKLPTIIGIGVVVLNILLNFAFYPVWGAKGIAIATSVSSMSSGIVLLLFLHLRRKVVSLSSILKCMSKAFAASAVMCGFIFAVQKFINLDLLSGTTFLLAILLLVLLCLVIYVLMLYLLKVAELHELLAMIKSKSRNRSKK